MTCKFGIGGVSRLIYKGPDKFMQAFTRRHVPCGTCCVPRASRTLEKCKSTRPPVGSIHPENLVQMPRTISTPDSWNLDRQTEGGKGGGRREGGKDRQKMPTYIPSIHLKNTKNLQMLKHINFLPSSYDFGKASTLKHSDFLHTQKCGQLSYKLEVASWNRSGSMWE